MEGLNDAQISLLKTQGYLLVEDVLSPEIFRPLICELEQIIDEKARRPHDAGDLETLFADEPFERRLARICAALENPSEILQSVQHKFKTEGMFKILTHPGLLAIVESLIGPEILAHPQFNLRAKLPNQKETEVPWHQDLGYLQPDASETFMVNFWIPLVDATRENGCMEVIAESHNCTLLQHHGEMGPGRNFKGIPDQDLPAGDRVPCPVRVGSVLLIQHKTIHRSIPNHSDHIRWSLDLRYSDPAMPTGRDYASGFIAHSLNHPDSVAHSLEDWLKQIERA